MKKSYLILAAVAGLFASCSQEVLVDETSQNEAQKPFMFETFTQKATRAADSNKLQDFYTVFGVYGWKTVDGTVVTDAVFENTPNEYFATDAAGATVYTAGKPSDEWVLASPFAGAWYYENIRYWDKMADSYQFFAIAPYEATPNYSVAAGSDNFNIYSATSKYDISTEYNLARTDLTATPVDETVAPKAELTYFGFNKDYMISDKVVNTTKVSDVNLTFHHILAKLNVKVKKADSYKGKQVLKVNRLTIANLDKEGYFDYTTGMTTKGWTSGDKARTIDINTPYALANDPTPANNLDGNYWIETLIFPQVATCKSVNAQANVTGLTDPNLYIEYQIGNEVFKVWYDFAHIWDNTLAVDGTYEFLQGNQYTLTLTIGPDPIHFDAEVTPWVTTEKNWDVDKNVPYVP